MEKDSHTNHSVAEPPQATQSPQRSDPHVARLEKRLSEAINEIWDNFVDPADALYDVDGARWTQLGGGASRRGEPLPFATEGQLRDIREQCRVLATTNEFAINGHENPLTKTLSRCGGGLSRGPGVCCVFRRVPTTTGPRGSWP